MFTNLHPEKSLYRFNDPAFIQQDMQPEEIIKRHEKIPSLVFTGSAYASVYVAGEIAKLIREKSKEGKTCVLGLATGSIPLTVYEELIRLHREEGLSFKKVITFNLDEYYPIHPISLQSYRRFMKEYLFDHIDILPENIHIPDGALSREEVMIKRRSIFKHQSQKDRPLFPGMDSREFWQRAEDRNHSTAELYDKLGMAEYQAIEVFVRFTPAN